jgi:hypothetical protein
VQFVAAAIADDWYRATLTREQLTEMWGRSTAQHGGVCSQLAVNCELLRMCADLAVILGTAKREAAVTD